MKLSLSPPPFEGAPVVVLWPDTFTNHLAPEIGVDAVEVDGEPVEGRRLENPYRTGGVALPAEALRRVGEIRVTTR